MPRQVVPEAARSGPFSPLLMTGNALHNMGRRPCNANGGEASKCVPIYRTKFAFIFRISVGAWFRQGAL